MINNCFKKFCVALLTAVLFQAVPISALWAQQAPEFKGVAPSLLELTAPNQCTNVIRNLDGRENGGQWLIGQDVPIYGQASGQAVLQDLRDSFRNVTCYSEVKARDRVFIADKADGVCGWVDRESLLDTNTFGVVAGRIDTSLVCATPRAMTLGRYCDELQKVSGRDDAHCDGVPRGLRAKGVLLGSTFKELPQFMSRPINGVPRSQQFFFTALEIHEIAAGEGTSVMALVGDGEGTVFGWIDIDQLQLWPTRLGLFYDEAGKGKMFRRERNMVAHWRNNGSEPLPDIRPGLNSDEIEAFIHGTLPLLSYPIIRTVEPSDGEAMDVVGPARQQVIFLGQTGEGSASQLLSEAELTKRVEDLQRLNVMIVLDTTESMLPYLPLVREGVADFVRQYRVLARDASNQTPNTRIGVYAYSDFTDPKKLGLLDPIKTAELMPPTRIGDDVDVAAFINGITRHQGLSDDVGLREEAALEAVVQFSRSFSVNPAWFENGQNIIIHLADHGSRSTLPMERVRAELRNSRADYIPIPVTTDDQIDASRQRARRAFVQQAENLFSDLVSDGDAKLDLISIDLRNFETVAPARVSQAIGLAVGEVAQAIQSLRQGLGGRDLISDTSLVRDLASSRVILDEIILEREGLDPENIRTFVEADTGWAPSHVIENGQAVPVEWSYTIAFEAPQVAVLREKLTAMCRAVGRPDQGARFRDIVVELARAFSGDQIKTNEEVRAILSDISDVPGAKRSLLAQSPQVLLQRANSSDPGVVDQLRKDVCWMAYHLENVGAGLYAQSGKLVWGGTSFTLAAGQEVTQRTYAYTPIVGAPIVYLPSEFFVLPENQNDEQPTTCEFFCN